jgi:hypothetical protein
MPVKTTAAIARICFRIVPASSLRAKVLKQAAMSCGAALSVWLLSQTYGLDLSAGFF